MSPKKLTEVEGIKVGDLIKRVPNTKIPFTPGDKPGFIKFRAERIKDSWFISHRGFVCFCQTPIRDGWTGFKVITIPREGMFCHVEAVYE
jgi:hypothetical protein